MLLRHICTTTEEVKLVHVHAQPFHTTPWPHGDNAERELWSEEGGKGWRRGRKRCSEAVEGRAGGPKAGSKRQSLVRVTPMQILSPSCSDLAHLLGLLQFFPPPNGKRNKSLLPCSSTAEVHILVLDSAQARRACLIQYKLGLCLRDQFRVGKWE